ncbi:MAG: hypothetical protein EOO24_23980 [Comamonadaceae bacterium]|nr:MAG: hypothetical protein EOO24_23980 [Comamonadaceae bacterium]
MSEPVTYPYATGELLERPANYSYSRFGGVAFLDAWRAQRSGLSAHAGSESAPAPRAPTDSLLEQLAQDLQRAAAAPAAIATLQRLLQRFEVTKRLHASYNERWRPVDPADYHGAARYLRFAEVLEQAYARDAHLPFLNGLLKCMDTLSTLAAELDRMQVQRLHALVTRERAHVERLALPREQRE